MQKTCRDEDARKGVKAFLAKPFLMKEIAQKVPQLQDNINPLFGVN